MYFTRATSPDYGGQGYATTGPGPLLIGALIGVIFTGAGAIGSAPTTGAFGVLADLIRALLPADTSALMLVAESPAAEEFVSAVAPHGGPGCREEDVRPYASEAILGHTPESDDGTRQVGDT